MQNSSTTPDGLIHSYTLKKIAGDVGEQKTREKEKGKQKTEKRKKKEDPEVRGYWGPLASNTIFDDMLTCSPGLLESTAQVLVGGYAHMQTGLHFVEHIPWLPKCDTVHSLYVILEMIDAVKNQPSVLTYWMATCHSRSWLFTQVPERALTWLCCPARMCQCTSEPLFHR